MKNSSRRLIRVRVKQLRLMRSPHPRSPRSPKLERGQVYQVWPAVSLTTAEYFAESIYEPSQCRAWFYDIIGAILKNDIELN